MPIFEAETHGGGITCHGFFLLPGEVLCEHELGSHSVLYVAFHRP